MQKVIPMNSHKSWATIVDKTPKQQPYPSTINAVQEASTQTTLSTLTINTPEQKSKNKKDKVDEYIKSWEKDQNLHHQQQNYPTPSLSLTLQQYQKNPIQLIPCQISDRHHQQVISVNH